MTDISLSESEEREAINILNQLEGYFISFFIFTAGVSVAILVMSVLRLNLPSATIQALYGVFCVSVGFCMVAGFLLLWTLLVGYQMQKGNGVVLMVKRPIRCINVSKRELVGKSYCVYKLLGFRYAFRIRRES